MQLLILFVLKFEIAIDAKFLHVDNKDSDQTAQMHSKDTD